MKFQLTYGEFANNYWDYIKKTGENYQDVVNKFIDDWWKAMYGNVDLVEYDVGGPFEV